MGVSLQSTEQTVILGPLKGNILVVIGTFTEILGLIVTLCEMEATAYSDSPV